LSRLTDRQCENELIAAKALEGDSTVNRSRVNICVTKISDQGRGGDRPCKNILLFYRHAKVAYV